MGVSRVAQVRFTKRLARLVVIAAISAASVAGVYAVDSKRQQANQTALSLRWARQMVTQSESLALSADARGERDPLAWAARLLSQGTDSRIVFASATQVPLPVAELESHILDPQTGIFDYTKIFDPNAGTGIRIRLYTTRTGIFGAKTVLQHDFTVTVLFLLIYGLLFFWVARRDSVVAVTQDSGSTPQTPPVPPELLLLKPLISNWIAEAGRSLTELGIHIREMVRAATKLASASRESRDLVFSLRLKLNTQLESLHAGSRRSDELTILAEQVEALLSRKPALDPTTQNLLKRLLASALRYATVVSETEVQLEPIASDADMALESLESTISATRAISMEIQATTQGIVEQSRKMGELRKKSG